ncbi:MAG: hypothetical protein JNK77_13335 [Saprospiraceae bacterium]|nr:hypothetical protein [Saprospiraceae bacterium]
MKTPKPNAFYGSAQLIISIGFLFQGAGEPANLAEQLNFWAGLSQWLKKRRPKAFLVTFLAMKKVT